MNHDFTAYSDPLDLFDSSYGLSDFIDFNTDPISQSPERTLVDTDEWVDSYQSLFMDTPPVSESTPVRTSSSPFPLPPSSPRSTSPSPENASLPLPKARRLEKSPPKSPPKVPVQSVQLTPSSSLSSSPPSVRKTSNTSLLLVASRVSRTTTDKINSSLNQSNKYGMRVLHVRKKIQYMLLRGPLTGTTAASDDFFEYCTTDLDCTPRQKVHAFSTALKDVDPKLHDEMIKSRRRKTVYKLRKPKAAQKSQVKPAQMNMEATRTPERTKHAEHSSFESFENLSPSEVTNILNLSDLEDFAGMDFNLDVKDLDLAGFDMNLLTMPALSDQV